MTDEAALPRKVMVVLTDVEWKALKIAAAIHDDSVQGYLTRLALDALHGVDERALELAEDPNVA